MHLGMDPGCSLAANGKKTNVKQEKIWKKFTPHGKHATFHELKMS